MKTLSSQYAQFTPEERLRLTIAADARGDHAEVERLMRSCPQMPWVVPDPEYCRGMLVMRGTVNEGTMRRASASCGVARRCRGSSQTRSTVDASCGCVARSTR